MTPGHNPALVALTQRVTELPSLPQALVELMRLLREPDFSELHCVALIERDQALCGRTLRLANSPFYGLSGRISTIRDAIQMLGLGTVGACAQAPLPRRQQAWNRIARDLDLKALAALTTHVKLEDVPRVAADIVAGQVRGRVVVDIR